MKKVLFSVAFFGLFCTSNLIASETENANVPEKIADETKTSEDKVNYWVTNIRMESETNGSYLYFTVNWEYTGNRPNPEIAFMVYIYNYTYLENSFLDTAYGIVTGSRDYKIKISSINNHYRILVDGSDGNPI